MSEKREDLLKDFPTGITISVHRPGMPDGCVRLDDVSAVAQGVHDAVARLIQRQLGYSGRARLRDDAKGLTSIVLAGVSKGSGVMECPILPVEGLPTRAPAGVTGLDLVRGVNAFEALEEWPGYLPGAVRHDLGKAVAEIVAADGWVSLTSRENGEVATCKIARRVGEALLVAEEFDRDQEVEVVGRIFSLHRDNRTIKLDAATRKISVLLTAQQFDTVDRDFRWSRVFASGQPLDRRCGKIHQVTEIRPAVALEADGLTVVGEVSRITATPAYQAAAARAEQISLLQADYDSYGALPVDPKTLDFALQFLGETIGVLLDFGVPAPVPFLAPTRTGGVQLEWKVEGRELELEIPNPSRFLYLAVEGAVEYEDEASRWQAVRLVRWVATGERE